MNTKLVCDIELEKNDIAFVRIKGIDNLITTYKLYAHDCINENGMSDLCLGSDVVTPEEYKEMYKVRESINYAKKKK